MKKSIFLWFIASVLPAGSVLLASAAQSPPQAASMKTERNIPYVENGHRNQVLDLYLPEQSSDQPLPLMIWIHGGAWMAGSQANPPILYLVNRDFAVASIQYRFSSDAIWPAQAYDCKAAIRFLRANAAKYNLNPDKFAVGGDSAGGHLAAFIGTSGDVEEMEGDLGNTDISSRVQAVVDCFGPTDFTLMAQQSGPGSMIQHDAPDSPESRLLGGPVQAKHDLAKTANPLTYIDKNDPPFLIMHGDKDPLVPLEQSVILAKALIDADAGEVTMKILHGAGHGGPQFHNAENRQLIEGFLFRNLKVAGNTEPAPPSQSAETAAVRTDAPQLPFATPLRWKSSDILVKPISDETHTIVSIKDPTVVYYDGKWHIYATAYSTSARTWTMVYLNFEDWKEAPNARLTHIDVNPDLRGYHCAPHLFYFTPHKKWYLIFQSQQPQYCTTDDISRPETWTAPKNFFEKLPPGTPKLPIDYHIICDDTHAYLFFTGDNGCFYRSRTKIEDFPNGFGDVEIAIQENRNDLFEGSMTYKIKGTDTYLTIIEALSPARYYRAWISNDLNGKWTPVPGADSWETPFAGINNVTFEEGVKAWTRDISHGELIRDNYDETPAIDFNNLKFLFQGRDPQSGGNYSLLPYRLGLLTLECPEKPALKDVFKDYCLMGGAYNRNPVTGCDPKAAQIAIRHNNTAPSENDLKRESVRPQTGQYNWGPADSFMEFCETNKMVPLGHTLIWQGQTLRWVYRDDSGNSLTRDSLPARMEDPIMTVVGRCKGRVKGWDVVNEALNDDGTMRNTQWFRIIGEKKPLPQYDHIAKAFEYAYKADPDAELSYNDYNLDTSRAKCDGAVAIVKHLQSRGLRIDGVGI